MKKSKIRGISIPMHILCGKDVFRPAQSNVFFENGYMYATNAYVAVRASIKEYTGFDEDEIKLLNGKQISAANFLKLYSCGILFVRENGIEDTSNGVLYKFKEAPKYPNVNIIFENTLKIKSVPTETVGMNFNFINLVGKCINAELHQLVFDFKGATKPILIKNKEVESEKLIGLVMPVNIND